MILVAALVWRVLPPAIRSGAAIESMAARKSIEGFLAFPLTFAAWMLPFDAWSPWTLTTWPTSCERVDGALSNSVFSSTCTVEEAMRRSFPFTDATVPRRFTSGCPLRLPWPSFERPMATLTLRPSSRPGS